MPPSLSHASVIDAKTASQCCDSLSTNSCTTATVSDNASSGVVDVDSSMMIGSSSFQAASSTKLVSAAEDAADGIAFAFGLAFAVMPRAFARMGTIGLVNDADPFIFGVGFSLGFDRGGLSPESSDRRLLYGGIGGG